MVINDHRRTHRFILTIVLHQDALFYDPEFVGFDYTQQEVVVVPLAVHNQNILSLDASFLAQINTLHQSFGFTDDIDKYLTFPSFRSTVTCVVQPTSDASCGLFTILDYALFAVNPCFDISKVTQMCSLLWYVLGYSTQLDYSPAGADVYFDRTDVKQGQWSRLVSTGCPYSYLQVSSSCAAKRVMDGVLKQSRSHRRQRWS